MRSGAGFTLVELLVTVAIVSLLSTAVLPMAELSLQRSREQELRWALHEIRTAIDEYKSGANAGRISLALGASGYPPNLRTLVEGVADMRDPAGKQRIYFLRRIPRDPTHAVVGRPAEETWGLRSYASSADAPQEGNDVFDVYSLSAATGMNGVPYREW